MNKPPEKPKIYHIVHIDKLKSLLSDGFLYSDAIMSTRPNIGSTIGINTIKEARLKKRLMSHPDLCVGQCVPFYFCPRSVMLFLFHKNNHSDLTYIGGQEPIIHLEADLEDVVKWANENDRRWAFTLSNARATYTEDYCSLNKLSEIDWQSVFATNWAGSAQEKKQAEFLLENEFPWALVERIGVYKLEIFHEVDRILFNVEQRPKLELLPDWYY